MQRDMSRAIHVSNLRFRQRSYWRIAFCHCFINLLFSPFPCIRQSVDTPYAFVSRSRIAVTQRNEIDAKVGWVVEWWTDVAGKSEVGQEPFASSVIDYSATLVMT